MKICIARLCAAAILAFGPRIEAAPTGGGKAWITIGDAAFREVRELIPGIVSVEASEVATASATEKVHAVAISEAELDLVAQVIHQRLKRCAGFIQHPTEAAARQALRRQRVARPVPAYLVDHRDVVVPMLAEMQEKNITDTINALSGFPNRYYKNQSGVDASNWLTSKWTGMSAGRADITVKQFAHASYPQQSVILTITGSDKPAEAVVLGAHLDSILVTGTSEKASAPGADDDASGVASLTEALRVIVEQEYRPRRTIHMIAYAAEEVGLRGSQEIARAFKQSDRKVVGVLQLDMTNYKGAANDIYLLTDYTDSQLNVFIRQLISSYLPNLKVGQDKCGYACSDHASWQAAGYPASMPFESSFAGDNPYIHTAKDTYANSGNQAAHALKFARLAAAFAVELSSN